MSSSIAGSKNLRPKPNKDTLRTKVSRDDKAEDEPSVSYGGQAVSISSSSASNYLLNVDYQSPVTQINDSFHFSGPELNSTNTRHSKVFRYSKEGSPYCSLKMLALSVHNAPPPSIPRKSCMASTRTRRNRDATMNEKGRPSVQWIDRVHAGRKLAEFPPPEDESWNFQTSPAVVHAEKQAIDQVQQLRAREAEETKDDAETCRQCDECTIA